VEETWRLAEIDGFVSDPRSNDRFLDGVDRALMIQIYRPAVH
jgi:hypothetical protein